MPRRTTSPVPGIRRIGSQAEAQAAEYLLAQGYTLVTRNFHSRCGEIDLIALDGDTLVFVEVKARRSTKVRAELALDDTKARKFIAAACDYLHAVGEPDRRVRFDLIAIDPEGLRHYPDAFRS